MSRGRIYHDDMTQSYGLVRDENKALVTEYIQYCKSCDKSPQTIKQYENWLKIFFNWNYENNQDKFFIDLKKRDFAHYLGYLRDLDMSPNRIATLKSSLSAFSNQIELMYEDEYPNFKNQLRGSEPVHIVNVREKTILSSDQITEMLRKLVEAKEYQLACYVALDCASGARKGELIQMKDSFFTEANEVFNGYMYATPYIRTKGRGKVGKKLRKYVIKEEFDPFLELWREQRKELGVTCDELFVMKREGQYVPATINAASSFASQISRICGLDFYAHSGRHHFCTSLKRQNFPDDIVIQIFGWADGSMLKIYNDITPEEAMSSFFNDFLKDKEQ